MSTALHLYAFVLGTVLAAGLPLAAACVGAWLLASRER